MDRFCHIPYSGLSSDVTYALYRRQGLHSWFAFMSHAWYYNFAFLNFAFHVLDEVHHHSLYWRSAMKCSEWPSAFDKLLSLLLNHSVRYFTVSHAVTSVISAACAVVSGGESNSIWHPSLSAPHDRDTYNVTWWSWNTISDIGNQKSQDISCFTVECSQDISCFTVECSVSRAFAKWHRLRFTALEVQDIYCI